MPKQAVTDEEINKCFSVISKLRPHLAQETFLPLVRKMGKEGYILVYIKDNSNVVSVAGYRFAAPTRKRIVESAVFLCYSLSLDYHTKSRYFRQQLM